MKRIALLAGGLLVLAALFFASFILVGETGEVVVLRSTAEDGRVHETRLWVVDARGSAWLRSGSSERGWAVRVRGNRFVELERTGEWQCYVATPLPTPEARDLVDRLMREKYGLADRWAVAFRTDEPLPFKLEPAGRPNEPTRR